MRAELKILNYVTILVIGFTLEAVATQIDYKGYDRIEDQEWTLEFTLEQPDSFCVRMPYPAYTMAGRWATYATKRY